MLPTNSPRTPELMCNRDHIQSAGRSGSILNRVDDARGGKKSSVLPCTYNKRLAAGIPCLPTEVNDRIDQ